MLIKLTVRKQLFRKTDRSLDSTLTSDIDAPFLPREGDMITVMDNATGKKFSGKVVEIQQDFTAVPPEALAILGSDFV